MRVLLSGLRLGLAVVAGVACAAAVIGAEPIQPVAGIVVDEDGRPVEGAVVQVCGEEKKLPDGNWGRNHTPHCLMPRVSIGASGRFTVPFHDKDLRVNVWVEKEGFAPSFVAGISPRPDTVKVIMKRGRQVAGHVNRLVKGKLEPVRGAAVYLGCSSGDLAHQKRVFDDPSFFVMQMQEGDDLPCLRTVFTGSFGEYVARLSPPPPGKTWFAVCLGELAPIEVKAGLDAKGPEFLVEVRVREIGKDDPRPVGGDK
jgi:hypothetical protein